MKPKTGTFRNFVAILLLGTSLVIAMFSLVRAVGTVGEKFSGFFFGPNLLVSISQRASWVGVKEGLKPLDRIKTVDGKSAESASDLIRYVSQKDAGEVVRYGVDRNGRNVFVHVPVTRMGLDDFLIAFLAPFLMGLLFLFFGGVFYFAQPTVRGSLVYLCLFTLIGLFCVTLFEAYTSFTFFRITLLYPLIGALSAHIFSLFPVTSLDRPRVKAAVGGLYVFSLFLVTWREVGLFDAETSEWLSRLSSVFILMVLMVDGLILLRGHQRAASQAVKDRIKVIGFGLVVASSVVGLWSLNFIVEAKSFHLDEGVLVGSVFPIFMSYAVLRKNIFGLDRVIRVSLSHGLAAAAVIALYLGVLGAFRGFMPWLANSPYSLWFYVALVGAGVALFNFLRRRAQNIVQRYIFRSQHNVAQAMAQFDRSLLSGLHTEEIATLVSRGLSELFQLERAGCIAQTGAASREPCVRTHRWENPPRMDTWWSLFDSEGFLAHLQILGVPVQAAEKALREPDRFQQSLSLLLANSIEVIVPLQASDRLYGLLLLGRKLSNERFESSDLEMLQPLSKRIGLSLENAALHAETEQQARLAALGKMSSVLIHDIRNPLGTIRLSAGTLKRRFPQGDPAEELVKIIQDEVDRMDHTISEILHYARPAGLLMSPVKVHDLLNDIVKKMEPTFLEAGVRLNVEFAKEEIQSVLDQSRFRRAVENLLINAREATGKGGTVVLSTTLEGSTNGHARFSVVVHDDGPGMKAEVRERIFQPFFSTKSGGTGLGLALVQQIVAEHGGTLELETRSGAGTRFSLEFPLSSNRTAHA